jgi:hypothetical protein
VVGNQIVRDEWLGMMRVRVERQDQGWALFDKSDAGVTAAMNSPLMTLGLAEPAFQVEVVLRQIGDGAYEQASRKIDHQFHDVPGQRSFLLGELPLKFFKLATPLVHRTVGRVERVGNRLDFLHAQSHLRLGASNEVQPAIDARR